MLGGHIPGAMPLAMLNVALGQKTSEGFALPGTALNMAFGHILFVRFALSGLRYT
jgi:hypothetical protein